MEWTNYTLPYFPGTRYFFHNSSSHRAANSVFDTPVITRDNPSGVLTAYYLNSSSELIAYNLTTGRSASLSAWPSNLSNYNTANSVIGFQEANGVVPILYDMGQAPGGYLWVAWYSLTNGSHYLVNTSLEVGSVNEEGLGVLSDSGWVFYENATGTVVDLFNIFSRQLVTATLPALPNWNSPEYVPSADQVVEDVNQPSNHTVLVAVYNLSFPGGVAKVGFRDFWSAPLSDITGPDSNNMPYFSTVSGTTTTLWGLGADDSTGGTTYHNFVLSLSTDLTQDSVISVTETGAVGTTDMTAMDFTDTSGYFLNGYNGYLASAADQAPFLDPLSETTIYANNSGWFNAFLTSQNFAFGVVRPWINDWMYLGTTGYENAYLVNATPGGSCGSTCTLTVYWLPSETAEFGPPSIQTGLAITVTPGQGPVGSDVTISGSSFSAVSTPAALVFDGVAVSTCASGSLVSGAAGSFTCTFVVPGGTLGSSVTVTDPSGAVATGVFVVTLPAIVVSPRQGPVGATVTVVGTGFSVSTPLASLVVDGVSLSGCTSGSLLTNSTGSFGCTFQVPGGTSGRIVIATDAGGQSAKGRFLVTVPQITVGTKRGPIGALTPVIGTDFSVSSTIGLDFDNVSVTTCEKGSLMTNSTGSFRCVVAVPSGTSGRVVRATDVGGQTAGGRFKVTTPRIALSSKRGPIGSMVTVTGNGFSESSTIGLDFDNVSIPKCLKGSLTTNSTGWFSCTLAVPSSTSGTAVVALDPGGQSAVKRFTVGCGGHWGEDEWDGDRSNGTAIPALARPTASLLGP